MTDFALHWLWIGTCWWVVAAYLFMPFLWRHYRYQKRLDGRPMVTRTAVGLLGDPAQSATSLVLVNHTLLRSAVNLGLSGLQGACRDFGISGFHRLADLLDVGLKGRAHTLIGDALAPTASNVFLA